MASSFEHPITEKTAQSDIADPIPSLASIMQEEEKEQKRAKRRKTPSKQGPKFHAGWNPTPGQNRIPSLSTIMIEQGSNLYTPPRFTFVPQDRTDFTEPTKKHNTVAGAQAFDRQTNETKVVNVRKQSLRALGFKDLIDWLQNPDHVYIGRNMTHYVPGATGSKWGNPFKMTKGMTRESCCEQYKQYVKSDTKIQANGKTLLQSLHELKGKTLGCWCHPELCHGHMLVQLIEEFC